LPPGILWERDGKKRRRRAGGDPRAGNWCRRFGWKPRKNFKKRGATFGIQKEQFEETFGSRKRPDKVGFNNDERFLRAIMVGFRSESIWCLNESVQQVLERKKEEGSFRGGGSAFAHGRGLNRGADDCALRGRQKIRASPRRVHVVN